MTTCGQYKVITFPVSGPRRNLVLLIMNRGLEALSHSRCDTATAYGGTACLCFIHNSHPLAAHCGATVWTSYLNQRQIRAYLSKHIFFFAWIMIEIKHVIGMNENCTKLEADWYDKYVGVNLGSLGRSWAPHRIWNCPQNHICWPPLVSLLQQTNTANKRLSQQSRDWLEFVVDLGSPLNRPLRKCFDSCPSGREFIRIQEKYNHLSFLKKKSSLAWHGSR